MECGIVTPWYKREPGLYIQLVAEINTSFPYLTVVEHENTITIEGFLKLFDQDNREIDKYAISVQLSNDYPESIPLVFETGNRIPKNADRHFNSETGIACLFLPEERYKFYRKGASISDFITGPVSSFFLGQTYYDLTHNWPAGQRSHGNAGIIEFYSELLKTTNRDTIVNFIEYLTKPQIKGHWNCYCGSKTKLRDCCLSALNKYRELIDPKDAKTSLDRLIKYPVSM